ncbi:COG3014 family protein [Sediminibacterium ginsengisoli]|uniref:Lipoprotein n=1 Tax=Sediminibacterium ginsengisoli TaxID=413434 RepID=A0A1T4MF67_9BACT|nr:hypothetical protein [Sediminibacterium ginsengisoli]SJZ65515.1 hypothetical protein SAMN04488132_103355 [Sediminibacterium ginsengisoli]
MNKVLKQAWVAWLLMPVLFSCATYQNKMNAYYNQVRQSDYNKAERLLANNSFLQQNRNRLLYYMEQGKVLHLAKQYDSSNYYLNLADKFIENEKKSAGSVVAGKLLNPMMETYMGEDHEQFFLHYYKALNYLYTGKQDDAIVEARRITLTTNAQKDKFGVTSNRYTQDAFVLMVQGMIYETAGDINNAFISYRNAADLYVKIKDQQYYGVFLPDQLKRDLLRTAEKMGFTDQVDKYSAIFGKTEKDNTLSKGGEAVIFFEKGMAPAKTEQNFILTNNGDGSNTFVYAAEEGSIVIPFDFSSSGYSSDVSLNEFRAIRVAIPAYNAIRTVDQASAVVNGKTYNAELTEDINTLAPAILKQHMLKILSDALVRQVVKKLVEKGISASAKEVAKNNSKEKDEKKKDDKAEAVALATGLIVNIFNTATEKADTRNWQSLPATVSYVRIPLEEGDNVVELTLGNAKRKITLKGTGSLQLYNWCVTR